MVRTFLACEHCRRSKLRCLSNVDEKGEPAGKCQRCFKLSLSCQYTPKPSQLKKQIRREKLAGKKRSPQANTNTGAVHTISDKKPSKIPANSPPDLVDDAPFLKNTINNYGNKHGNKCANYLDTMILPNIDIMIEVINQFFDNQYHSIFNFLHRETYLKYIQSSKFGHQFFNYDDPEDVPEFTPCTLLAILALCAKDNKKLIEIYGEFNQDHDPIKFIPNFSSKRSELSPQSPANASKYFAFYSRLLLKDMFDTPSIQRVQSLTILSSHEWSEGNAARSYLYIGIAARMGAILGLGCPRGVCYEEDNNEYENEKDRFIGMESKRRTIWSVFMMDRCNSSGRNRSHALKIEDIEISLPCPEENFQKGIPIEFPSYNECFTRLKQLTSLDFTIIGYELWSKIAKWVGEIGSKKEKLNPNDPNSIFYKLSNDLKLLKESMPPELHVQNLKHHLNNQNLNFGFLHQLLYLSGIFLNREYFYYSSNISKIDHYEFTKKLIHEVQESSSLIKTLVSTKKFIVTPFTAFELFTNAVTCLSISSILNDMKLKALGIENMEILKSFFQNDHLGSTWHSISNQLLKYFESCHSDGIFNQTLQQNTKLSNLINDYGQGDIPEQLTTHPYEIKKVDLNDILNSSDSESNSSYTTKSNPAIHTQETDSNDFVIQSDDSSVSSNTNSKQTEISTTSWIGNSFENDIDKYFRNWDKIIPNWNDVFVEDRMIDDINLLLPTDIPYTPNN